MEGYKAIDIYILIYTSTIATVCCNLLSLKSCSDTVYSMLPDFFSTGYLSRQHSPSASF